ncbi:MAG: competence protein CoiA family protein [Sphaerochaetaceae bacterium]|nr:competence protein CoiA family protein [Sphaerochaetaceae bacterium]
MNTHKLLTYALDPDNRLMYIDDVPNGLECNCICPGCKEKLIAKNDGKVREHHFAHASNKECITGYQTMIHLLAKEIIVNKRILPGFGINNKPIVASQIRCEDHLNNLNIIPDLIAIVPVPINYNYIGSIQKEIPFIIEIYVSHKVDEAKAKIIKDSGIPAIEIDLSNSEATTAEELIKEIYNPANWNYINKEVGKQFIPRININMPNLAVLFPYTYPVRHTNRRNNIGYRNHYKRRK